MNINITIPNGDLEQEKYMFYINDDFKIILSHYYKYQKKTKRHKFIIKDKYSNWYRRDNTIDYIEISEDIKQKVKQEILNSLKFK